MGTHPIFESDFDCLTDFVIFGERRELNPFIKKVFLMRVWLFYIGFYCLIRQTIVKSSPKVDIIFRRFEFFFVSQLLAVPVLAYQLLANAKFEATRVVPFVFSMLWRTKIDIRGEIPNENCVIVCNHQSGLDICPLLK